MTLAAGWYGKIPSLGDFASRRLPAEFIGTWDRWLQHSMAASRATLGERWLDAYMTSPIWRFALMPQTVDAGAWAGLLMPSIDRVGRHFPLTLALRLAPDGHGDRATMILSSDPWFAALEKIALAALDVGFSADDLERELTRLPFPPGDDSGSGDDQAADALADWWLHPSAVPQAIRLPPGRSALEILTGTAQRILDASSVGKSIWWSVPGDSGTTEVNLFAGLPPQDSFAGLLLGGDWREQPRA